MIRQSRKLEHVHYALKLRKKAAAKEFADISLIHRALPGLNYADIAINTELFGIALNSPLIINAITGGAQDVKQINATLANVAHECKLAMAVGSQMAALEDPTVADTFKIVRQINRDGIIFANIGAYATPELAQRAVEMVEANALQIHLNAPQELVMREGDRNFREWRQNIARIMERVKVPVIVKEVGFGISQEDACQLQDLGIKAIDIGGRGGTNFVDIESARRDDCWGDIYREWGIATPVSLLEVASVVHQPIDLIASGGLTNGLQTAKMLALGAKGVALAGILLQELMQNGIAGGIAVIKRIEEELKMAMLMVGADKINELQKVPVVIVGETAQWLTLRGIDLIKYARR